MHGLLDRLRIGREQPRSDPLEAAQARIGELTEVLQGLVNLSDSSRSRDFAEVKRLLAHARKVLSNQSHVAQMRAVKSQNGMLPTGSASKEDKRAGQETSSSRWETE